MKNPFLLLIVILSLWPTAMAADVSQVEFTAPIKSIGTHVIDVALTPSFTLSVRLSAATEINDANNRRISIADLDVGDLIKVEAVFIDGGVVAREVEITFEQREFELVGRIDNIELSGSTARIQLLGFWIRVPSTAEVQDSLGGDLFVTELQVGDLVKVEGGSEAGALVARQIKQLDNNNDFAWMRLEGVIEQIQGSRLLIRLPGNIDAFVEITARTETDGPLVVGASVIVHGRLNTELITVASRILSVRPFRLVPDELRLARGGAGHASIVLSVPAPADLMFLIVSRDPTIADSSSDRVVIAAGELTATFDVQAGDREGRAKIVVTGLDLSGATATLEVEVEDNGPDDGPFPGNDERELEIKWAPRKVESAGLGQLPVQLRLNQVVPHDITVELFVKDGDPSMVSFPPQVMFPAGETSVSFLLEILKLEGEVKVRAALPAGGDTDDIDIRFRAELRLEWSPDRIEMVPSSSRVVELRLDRPAPRPVTIEIHIDNGSAGTVTGVPAQIVFAQGQQVYSMTIQSGSAEGRVVFEAELPESFGGDKDTLDVRVEQ